MGLSIRRRTIIRKASTSGHDFRRKSSMAARSISFYVWCAQMAPMTPMPYFGLAGKNGIEISLIFLRNVRPRSDTDTGQSFSTREVRS